MIYNDIVECIKINQIKQGISGKNLADRVGVHPQVLTEIKGYRLKVSESLFMSIIRELSITHLTQDEISYLLSNQQMAKLNKHKKYIKEKNKKN